MDYITIFGYVLGVTGSVAFIPQIRIILNSKSGEGLDLVMFSITDFVTALISAFCIKSGLDISNWLELLITNMQVFFIHCLARHYLQQQLHLRLLVVAKIAYLTFLTLAPFYLIKIMMNCLLPLMLVDRGGAVIKHFKNKSTGQLSGATLTLQWLQFSGRLMTSLVSEAEGSFILPMTLSWFFASIILIQWVVYRKSGKEEKSE